jgi:N-methylhydantoinase B/oxoprolinase/acetone carboxylase alpha subunit
VSIQADRTRSAPWGIFGGRDAARTRYSVVRIDGTVEVVGGIDEAGNHHTAKRSFDLSRGERLRIESAGGGGYGDPRDRDPLAIEQDVVNGHVTREQARAAYGYVG